MAGAMLSHSRCVTGIRFSRSARLEQRLPSPIYSRRGRRARRSDVVKRVCSNTLADLGPARLEIPLSVPLTVLEEYEKKEKCGLFGVWGTKDAASITYAGLFAQQ